MPLIECSNLTLAYNQYIISKNINFKLNQGDYMVILGENGSGKSTLLKVMLGQHSLSEGEKRALQIHIKNHEFGYLPQQTDIKKDFPASVKEVIYSGFVSGNWRPFYTREEKKKYNEVIDELEIQHLQKKSIRNLSGGERQRVLLARALCSAERILFLDEPVTGLDPLIRDRLYGTIKRINKDGLTIVMVSHDVDKAIADASHVLFLNSDQPIFTKAESFIKDKDLISIEKKDRGLEVF